MDWLALYVSFKLALVSTAVLLVIGIPIAWWMAHSRSFIASIVSTIVSLPIVMPSTVLGFYLLIFMSPSGWLGKATEKLGIGTLSFSFSGLVIGAVIYSFPFVVQPLKNAFRYIGTSPLEMSQVLGYSKLHSFFKVILPLAKPSIISASILGFSHTLGEFGLVLMIGGSIPGETKVISVSIFESVEALEWQSAHAMSLIMLVIAFSLIFALHMLERRRHDKNSSSEFHL